MKLRRRADERELADVRDRWAAAIAERDQHAAHAEQAKQARDTALADLADRLARGDLEAAGYEREKAKISATLAEAETALERAEAVVASHARRGFELARAVAEQNERGPQRCSARWPRPCCRYLSSVSRIAEDALLTHPRTGCDPEATRGAPAHVSNVLVLIGEPVERHRLQPRDGALGRSKHSRSAQIGRT